MPKIVVGGLGPADVDLLTPITSAAIAAHDRVRLRTARHPAATVVDAPSYDHVYESATSFADVYEAIVEDLVALSASGDVLYLVPGAPTVAEHTVELLVARDGVELEILPALSFLDLSWARLQIDPVEVGVTLVDALVLDEVVDDLSGAVLIGQCHSAEVMNDVRFAFGHREPERAVVLHHLGLPDEAVVEVAWDELDGAVDADHLTSVFVPEVPRTVAAASADFARLVRRLRNECPWDAEQTHQSLVRHLLEEAHEAAEAIEADPIDDDAVASELGDVLFQVYLHSTIADEVGAYDLVDVIDGIAEKLIRRHPHVFGDQESGATGSSGPSEAAWEQAKLSESGAASVVDNVPALPSLALAAKLIDKSRTVGFVWPDSALSRAKIDEELAEFDAEADHDGRTREFGDVLLASVGHARDIGIDPDAALRASARVFRQRVRDLELRAAADGVDLHALTTDELLARWAMAKRAVAAGEDPPGPSSF